MKPQEILLRCIVLLYSISGAFFAPLEWSDNSVSVEYGGVTAEKLLSYSTQDANVISNEIDSFSWPSLKGLECDACKFITGFMQGLFRLNKTHPFIAEAAVFWCEKLKIEDTRVCSGIIPEFQNEVLSVFDEVGLRPDEVCGLVLGSSCGKVRDLYPDWNISLPSIPKPPVKPVPAPKPGSPVYKILHLSDVHIDGQYAENTSTKCGEPLCCREYNGQGKAGYWGSYECDIPMRTFEATLKHIKAIHQDIDFVYWTGDVPAHDVWNQTRPDQLKAMELGVKMFVKYFPNTPVYPAMGNHESAPVNSFPPPYVKGHSSNKWLLNSFADFWSFWLPMDTFPTIKLGGYYTILHSKGFRIISLNDNYCNNENWWLLINNTDPAGELQWLIKVLQSAEDKKEKVHIIGHMPVGRSTCLKHWSWNYYKIINRYESIIMGQFFGHTHQDHFELYYDLKNKTRATNIAYIGPSLTTYQNLNPGYRIYTSDGNYSASTFAVLDHSTYYLDLADTTKDNMVWKFEYSAKEAYNMKSLQPAAWDDLVTRFGKNYTLFQSYYKYKWKCSPFGETCTTRACIVGEMCALRTGRSHDDDFFCRNVTRPEYNMC